jgi:hypothetical protein
VGGGAIMFSVNFVVLPRRFGVGSSSKVKSLLLQTVCASMCLVILD